MDKFISVDSPRDWDKALNSEYPQLHTPIRFCTVPRGGGGVSTRVDRPSATGSPCCHGCALNRGAFRLSLFSRSFYYLFFFCVNLSYPRNYDKFICYLQQKRRTKPQAVTIVCRFLSIVVSGRESLTALCIVAYCWWTVLSTCGHSCKRSIHLI